MLIEITTTERDDNGLFRTYGTIRISVNSISAIVPRQNKHQEVIEVHLKSRQFFTSNESVDVIRAKIDATTNPKTKP